MATGIVNRETVSHRMLTGDVLVRNVDITGWSKAGKKIEEISENGRLYGEVTGTTVNLYRSINSDGSFTSTEKVLTGTGAEGALITLAAANSSGLSGYLRYTGSGTFDIVIAYAGEDDVLAKIPGESQQLVWSVIEPYLTAPRRLQPLLDEAKRKIDDRLIRDMQNAGLGTFVRDADGNAVGEPFTVDLLGRFQLAVIANPEELREVTVWQVLREAADKLIGSNDFAEVVIKRYKEAYTEAWANLRLAIDADANLQQDGTQRVSPTTYKPKRR